jgi:GNAT superfamily N-acetyltransferase
LPALLASEAALNAETAGQLDPTVSLHWPDVNSPDGHRAHLANPRWLILVADDAGTIVGHLAGSIEQPDWRTVPVATIFSMHVAAVHRGTGIGSALVSAFRHWAVEQSAGVLEVTTYSANEAAKRFYRRCGFQPYTSTLQQVLNSGQAN